MDRESFTDIFSWTANNKKPFLIAGPCSAESEEQVINTAKKLKETVNPDLFRAGIWKPRTRPGSFEGVGKVGLKWLQKVQQEIQIPVTTEVANAKHVEWCLQHDIKHLWVGARTTVNPFSVQEIADAMKGVNGLAVMIKNPINPDLQLWIGAIERFAKAGIKKIAAIHRGFSTFDTTPYRYIPKWELPIELKRTFPELDILCDPSHIAGTTNLLQDVSQKAMDLNMTGLMVESHLFPAEAKSDRDQQITPVELFNLINKLTIREKSVMDIKFKSQLEQLRKEIDEIDYEILEKIAARMNITKKIGRYKKENNVTILQLERWNEIMKTRIPFGKNLSLSEGFLKSFLNDIHNESIQIQTEILNKEVD